MDGKKLLSVSEVSKILRISRMHVLRKIQSGDIKAEKVGKAFVIRKEDLPGIHRPSGEADKKSVEAAVEKTMSEFGDVIRKLGENRVKELTLEHVEQIAHGLAERIMKWDEPIPEFGTRFKGKLEGCLQAPLQTFAQRDLYPAIEDKGAILFYLLVKNHPFQNGNKRIAVTSLLTFLALNRKWLNIPPDELYKLALWVAESLPTAKDGTLTAIKDTLRRYLIKWEK